MVLYVPVGSEDVVTDTYLRQFWSASCGYSNTTAHPNCALGTRSGSIHYEGLEEAVSEEGGDAGMRNKSVAKKAEV